MKYEKNRLKDIITKKVLNKFLFSKNGKIKTEKELNQTLTEDINNRLKIYSSEKYKPTEKIIAPKDIILSQYTKEVIKIRYTIKEEDTQCIKKVIYSLENLEDYSSLPFIKRDKEKFTILKKELFTNCLSKEKEEIYIGDRVENILLGKGIVEQFKSDVVIRFTEGMFYDTSSTDFSILGLSYVVDFFDNVSIINNIKSSEE